MVITLVPHTQKPAEVHLLALHPQIQSAFNDLLNQAAGLDRTQDAFYRRLHQEAADTIGVRLPASRELARCTCEGCHCDIAFDADHARYYTSYRIEFVQCPACADEHRIYSD